MGLRKNKKKKKTKREKKEKRRKVRKRKKPEKEKKKKKTKKEKRRKRKNLSWIQTQRCIFFLFCLLNFSAEKFKRQKQSEKWIITKKKEEGKREQEWGKEKKEEVK